MRTPGVFLIVIAFLLIGCQAANDAAQRVGEAANEVGNSIARGDQSSQGQTRSQGSTTQVPQRTRSRGETETAQRQPGPRSETERAAQGGQTAEAEVATGQQEVELLHSVDIRDIQPSAIPAVLSPDLVVSNNATGVAWVEPAGSRVQVMYNGEAGPPFSGIEDLTLSENGAAHAYVAAAGNERHIVFNGEIAVTIEEGTAEFVETAANVEATQYEDRRFLPSGERQPVRVSPNGSRHAAVVRREGQDSDELWLDGAKLGEFPPISILAFTPDDRLVFVAGMPTRAGRNDPPLYQVYVEGTPGPRILLASPLRFGPDSGRLAYSATTGVDGVDVFVVDTQVIVDGADGRILAINANENLDEIAWAQVTNNAAPDATVYVNGSAAGEFSSDATSVFVGPSGGYLVQDAGGKAVANGVSGRDWEEITSAFFADSGKTVVYVGESQAGKFVVRHGGDEYGPYQRIGQVVLSNDGSRLAYTADNTFYLDGKVIADRITDGLQKDGLTIGDDARTLFLAGPLDDVRYFNTGLSRAREKYQENGFEVALAGGDSMGPTRGSGNAARRTPPRQRVEVDSAGRHVAYAVEGAASGGLTSMRLRDVHVLVDGNRAVNGLLGTPIAMHLESDGSLRVLGFNEQGLVRINWRPE